tara:strand:- start:2669 stop:3538 length:870 start_codon:yes stop_codon:yes gene_type:complete
MKYPIGRGAMEDSDKIKGVLDGTIDPSEISGDKKLYSMAERIYGREALEDMGVEPPVEPPESGIKAMNGNGGVEIPIKDSVGTVNLGSRKKPRRRVVLPLIMFTLLTISGFNVVVGIGTVLPICEDEPPEQELEFSSSAQLQNNTLFIVWKMTGLNNGSSYTIEWQVSQNGSAEIVDTGNSTWVSDNDPVRFDNRNWYVDAPPYSYLSTLYEDDLIVAFSNGSGDSITTLSEEANRVSYCDSNTRLIWTEYQDFENKDAWGQSGTGEIEDGAMMMLFALMMIITARKRS